MPEFDSTIRFAPIPEYPGYIASSDGFIWSTRSRNGQGGNNFPARIMKGNIGKEGYLRISVHSGSRDSAACRFVHLLVMYAFIGPKPEGMEARHLNGIKTDNRIDNLVWGTHIENMADQWVHGTRLVGVDSPNAKLNPAKIQGIRKLYDNGVNCYRIGKMFGVNAKTVSAIVTRKTWKHVT